MGQIDDFSYTHIPKIFVICDRKDTAPVWGYILRQQGLIVLLETSFQKAIDHWSDEVPDLLVIDIDIPHQERMELYRKIRSTSVLPILFLLPAYHETEILDAYAAGVDEVVVKPVSPAIFLAKIITWVRRSWTMPMEGLSLLTTGSHRLDPTKRCLMDEDGNQVELTNLEFRLLHLLMSRPAHVFDTNEIIDSLWGGYGEGDAVMLKNVVYRLRRKIEKDPSHPTHLQTGLGGYLFQG